MPRTVLATIAQNPSVAKLWHKTRNGSVKPSAVAARSKKVFWWQCPKVKEHEWQGTPDNRSQGKGCPFCSRKRFHKTNALSVTHPQLAKQWHKTKNKNLRPTDVMSGSSRKIWWWCSKNAKHVWQASLLSRAHNGRGCPYCLNYKILPETSLATVFPEIVREWDNTLNGDLNPRSIAPHTNIAVWWRCLNDNKHVWKASVGKRTGKTRHGCPYCSNRKVDGKNTLSAINPQLAAQWHPTKNGNLKPDNIVFCSSKKVWWKCSVARDHEWQAILVNRSKGVGCPFCAHQKVSKSNCLASTHPQIAKQWHPHKNGDLKPSDVVAGSRKKVWWCCDKSPYHDWCTAIEARSGGHGCPYCSGRLVAPDTSLTYKHPLVAQQWHPKLNGKLKPTNITAGSKRKVWWRCLASTKHIWQASVSNVVKARVERLTTGCPFCARAEAKMRGKTGRAKAGLGVRRR